MPAAVYTGDGHLAVQEVALPAPRPGEALVEVSHCGICGTDLHLVLERYAHRVRCSATNGPERSGQREATPTPLSIGFASSQTRRPAVASAARAARPSVRVPAQTSTRSSRLSGAFTRYVIVDAARLLQIPAGLQSRAAALTEPTAIALHTVNSPASSRRPRPHHRRWSRRPADARGAPNARRRRHHGGRTCGDARERARGARRAQVVTPDDLPRRRWGVRCRRRSRSCSSAPGTRRGRSRRSISSTMPARSCSSAPGTISRVSTTTGRSCSSSRCSAPTTTTRRLRGRARTPRFRRGCRSNSSSSRKTSRSTRCADDAPPRRGRAAGQGAGATRREAAMSRRPTSVRG